MGINPGLLMGLSTLKKVDTTDYDNVKKNFQALANQLSQDENFGTWNWNVDGSDDARQRAEQATWASYLDKMQPLYDRQTDDMQTRLINQGLTPGTEAYERAMSDLQDRQNAASNQAAYAATLNGQNAFSQSLNDSLNAANFGNQAQLGNQDRIWNLLQNSMSSYDRDMQSANLVSAEYARKQQEKQAKKNATNSMISSGLKIAGTVAGGMFGGPAGAAAGGAIGGAAGNALF